jgi:anti-sigma factor RsiW
MTQGIDTDTSICPPMEASINLFLDGELAFEDQADVYRHLADCEDCRRYVDSLLVVRRIIREENLSVPPQVDEAFFERLAAHKSAVTEAVERSNRRFRRREQLPKISRALTLGAIAALIVGGVITTSGESPAPGGEVVGEEELVNFPRYAPLLRDQGAVYVFYPGLTIEAENWVEPASLESL